MQHVRWQRGQASHGWNLVRLAELQAVLDIMPAGLLVTLDGRVLRESASLERLLAGEAERHLVYLAAQCMASGLGLRNGTTNRANPSLGSVGSTATVRVETRSPGTSCVQSAPAS